MSEAATPDLPAPGQRVELVCLKDSFDVIRSRVPPDGPIVVVRTGMSRVRPVPGETFAVEVERSWVFGHTRYVKGVVTEARLDLPRLELQPLRLADCGVRDPEEEPWLFDEDQDPLYDKIRAAGPRPQYEMKTWPEALERAERHYRMGVAIGELSLPAPVLDFQGLLPWGLIDNRPFLRWASGPRRRPSASGSPSSRSPPPSRTRSRKAPPWRHRNPLLSRSQ